MRAPADIVLFLMVLAAGAALQIAATAPAADEHRGRPRHVGIAVWSAAMAVALLVSVAAFLVPPAHVELALFVRTVCLVGSGVMTPFVLAHVGGVPFPRWAQLTVLGSAALRVALWPTTDLVYAHRIDAMGDPVYGPLLALTTAPFALLTFWIAIRTTMSVAAGRERRAFGASVVTAFATVVASIAIGSGPVAEALGAMWPLPLLVGIDVLLRAQVAAQRAELTRFDADRAALAARMSEANEELGRALAMRENLIAVTSHELRTPLTPLRGALETLEEHGATLGETVRTQMLALASRNAARMEALVDGLLTASRARSGLLDVSRSTFEAATVLQEVTAGWRDVTVTVQPADLRIVADRTHVTQIVENLVTNARKYGAPPVSIVARADGPLAVIAVVDNGPGVPAAFVPQLFEPFTQASTGTTRTASGVGLGLSISRTLSELQGGTLEYVPADGLCRFVLCVPAATSERDEPTTG